MSDLNELLDEFQQQEKIYRFDGESGFRNFEKILKCLGYLSHNFRYGNLIDVFLINNPDAVETLLEWIGEQNLEEWRENIESHLKER